MSERDEVLAALRAAMPELRQRWSIRSLALFGSVAREEAGAASDLDILVEFEESVILSDFLPIAERLSAMTGRSVELVSRRALKPFIGRQVLQEAIPV
jgi:uncharacterized protein